MVEQVTGTLEAIMNHRSVMHWVLLDIHSAVQTLQADDPMITISAVELVSSHGVPDGGPYTLCFKHDGKQYETIGVYIENGKFFKSSRR